MAFELIFHECSEQTVQKAKDLVSKITTKSSHFEVKTSGSTGTPKTIELAIDSMKLSAKRTNEYFELNESSQVVLPLSIDRIAGIMAIVRANVGDYRLHICEPSVTFYRSLPENSEYDLVSCSINQFHDLHLQNQLNRFKHILLGGSMLPASQEARFTNSTTRVFIGYGMTETIAHVAIRELPNEYYQPLDGVLLTPVKDGTVIHDKRTGIGPIECTDLIQFNDSHSFKIIGRSDFVINSGGIKIHPEQIEEFCRSYLNCSVVLSSIPDSKLGEKVVLVTESAVSLDEQLRVNQLIEKHFSKYAVPKQWLVHSIPVLNELKIDRKKLKAILAT